jgi:hypothetical protein
MRKFKYIFIVGFSVLFVFAAISMGMAQTFTLSPIGTVTYNKFIAADMGFTEGGKDNKVFQITFAGSSAVEHHLYIEITSSDGKTLLSGTTDKTGHTFDADFSGKTLWNYDILDKLGGRFSVSSSASTVKDKILKTGEIPEGLYTVSIELRDKSSALIDGPEILNIQVIPPYLASIYPVDTSVTKAGMNFKIVSKHVDNKELHVYSDPSGNVELTGPTTVLRNVGDSFDASSIASLLTNGEIYYWQIHGEIDTTHGDELVKSYLNPFLYFEDTGFVEDLGLSEVESSQIMKEIFEIVNEIINKRAANSLKGFEVERVLIDGSVVSNAQDIMAILKLIKEKEVTVNSAAFR